MFACTVVRACVCALVGGGVCMFNCVQAGVCDDSYVFSGRRLCVRARLCRGGCVGVPAGSCVCEHMHM